MRCEPIPRSGLRIWVARGEQLANRNGVIQLTKDSQLHQYAVQMGEEPEMNWGNSDQYMA
jgi:hypothetical protein